MLITAKGMTGKLPGLIPLVIGMPLVLLTNYAIQDGPNTVKAGLYNGTTMTLLKVEYDPREILSNNHAPGSFVYLTYQPLYLLVKVKTKNDATRFQMPGLPANVLALYPAKMSYSHTNRKTEVAITITRRHFAASAA